MKQVFSTGIKIAQLSQGITIYADSVQVLRARIVIDASDGRFTFTQMLAYVRHGTETLIPQPQ